jgi:hypothetical protein
MGKKQDWVPYGFDTIVPNAARMCDYMLRVCATTRR